LILFKEEKLLSTDAVDTGKKAKSFSKIFICGNKYSGYFVNGSNASFGKLYSSLDHFCFQNSN